MRKIIIIILISTFISNCRKQDELEINYDGIVVCDYERNDVIYHYMNLDSISTKNKLDLNKDGQVDIELGTFYYSSPNGYYGGTFISIEDSSFEFALSDIDGNRFNCGDTINSNINWSVKDSSLQNHAEFYPFGGSSTHIYNWTVAYDDSAYIAVRYFKINESMYGWIKVKDSETRVVEYVFEK